jgi:hypothetical protein
MAETALMHSDSDLRAVFIGKDSAHMLADSRSRQKA